MGERDEFDRIVENLDLDLDFPDEPPVEPVLPTHPSQLESPAPSWSRSPDEPTDEGDDAFYRTVDPPEPKPLRRNVALAWLGVVGGPLLLVLCSLVGYIVPRPVLITLSLTFVAGAIYLVSQLPDRRPDADGGDDGAVL